MQEDGECITLDSPTYKKAFVAVAYAYTLNETAGEYIRKVCKNESFWKFVNSLRISGNFPIDLEKKSVFLAAQIFELCGKSKKGKGQKLAQQILDSGKALAKFLQIVKAQQGKIPKEFRFAKFCHKICAAKSGKIKSINNKKINMLAVLAGSPAEDTTGLYLSFHVNDKVKKGDPLLTIYSESRVRMRDAKNYYKKSKPIVLDQP